MKKNRFYYSEKQDGASKRISGLFPYSKTYVKNDNGEYVQYSEWCSLDYSTCNWEDAVLVYETDDEVIDRVHRGNLKEGMVEAKYKEDLRELIKPSMLVVMRDGSTNIAMQIQNDITFIEVDSNARLCDCMTHMEMSEYDENLKLGDFESLCDIMEIYGFERFSFKALNVNTKGRELIWKRDEQQYE